MSEFIFQWPFVLPLLLLALPLWWLLGYARTRRSELIQTMGGGLSTHRRLRDTLRIGALVLLVLAMARPGYSPEKLSISRIGRDVVFAIDVSQSMLAEDVAPSRLEVAKQAVRDALNTFSNERVGLVVYAGSATILCPLTYDYDFVRYMLEQTHTRSTDFGGTTLQAAVEKVVDQVLMTDRAGVQDLVVMTDGGDHDSQMPRVTELLNERGVDLLLLGIGNPNEASPIPIEDAEGVRTLLRSDEAIVYTKLDDATLRDLAAQSINAEYVAVGNQVFDLGQIYVNYVAEREVSVSEGEEGIIAYQEGAVFFMMPALLLLLLSECWGAKGLQFGQAFIFVGLLTCMPEGEAATSQLQAQFADASKLYTDGSFVEAETLFSALALAGDSTSMTPSDLAAVQLNRGLCLMELSRAESEASAELGLGYAQQAQLAFLAAKRYTPQMDRSGIRLESTTAWVSELQVRIAAEAQEQDEMQAQMEQLVELLQALLAAQQELRQKVVDGDVNRRHSKRAIKAPPPSAIEAPADAAANAPFFVKSERELQVEAERMYVDMQQLDTQITPPVIDGIPAMESLLAEPLKLMAKVAPAMERAAGLLANGNTWPAGRAEQQIAEQLIEEILDLLGNDSSDESDGDEFDEMEDYEDYEYSDEMDESMMSSMPMNGDFAAGGEMQALPVPNYSADDILMEEQGSLQFRQQQRAKANAGKVEKDY
ncbi:MAG: VWA domain-containing protein [Opitutae bacterium]|nr:VWA domain-containing protein [Opitutae bacterium]